MALKKKTGGDDDRAAKLALLKGSAKDLSTAAKKEAPQGYTKTPDIIKAFKLKAGKTATTQAKLVRIGSFISKGDPKKKRKPALNIAFNFTCVGSTGKGQTPSIIIGIEERKTKDGIRGKDKAFEDIMFTMQRCGISTSGIKKEADLLDALDAFNELDRAEKPVVSLTLSTWGETNEGLNVRVNKLLEDFEEEEGDEDGDDDDEEVGDEDDDEEGDDSDESDDEEDEEPPFKKSGKSRSTKSSKSSKSKPADDDEEDDEEAEEDDAEESDDEEEESEDEESEDEVEYDEEDPSTWVGYECKAKPNGYAKTTKFEITEYLPKGKKLKIKDPKGKVVTVSASVVEVV